jgi:hypothetical protein
VKETEEKAQSDDGKAAVAASGPSTYSVAVASIDANSFGGVFAQACKNAREEVISNNVLKIGNTRHGALLLELAVSLHAQSEDMRCLPVTDCFRTAFVNKLLITVGEREEFMCQIHEIMMSLSVASAFRQFVESRVSAADSAITVIVLNIWVRKLVVRMTTNCISCVIRPNQLPVCLIH